MGASHFDAPLTVMTHVSPSADRVYFAVVRTAVRTWHGRLPLEWLVKAYLVDAVRRGHFKAPDKSYRAWLAHMRASERHKERLHAAAHDHAADLTDEGYVALMHDLGWSAGVERAVSRGSLGLHGEPAQQALALIGMIALATFALESDVAHSMPALRDMAAEARAALEHLTRLATGGLGATPREIAAAAEHAAELQRQLVLRAEAESDEASMERMQHVLSALSHVMHRHTRAAGDTDPVPPPVPSSVVVEDVDGAFALSVAHRVLAASSASFGRGGGGGGGGRSGGGGGRSGGGRSGGRSAGGGSGIRSGRGLHRGSGVRGGGGGFRPAVTRVGPVAGARRAVSPGVGRPTFRNWGHGTGWRGGWRGARLYYPYRALGPLGFLPFLGGISLALWMRYEWFRLWYYQQSYAQGYGVPGYAGGAYYSPLDAGAALDGGAGMPPLGYGDPAWGPEQIDEHLRYLENTYPDARSRGYRIIYNPLQRQYTWVAAANVPAAGAPLPMVPGVRV